MKRGKKFYSKKYWKYAVLFNLPLIPHYLSNTVLASSDRIMIERMIGAAEAGIYTLAYSLSQIMTMVNDSLNKTMSPWLYQRICDEDYLSMSKVVYPSLIIIAAANLALIAIAPEAVAIFAPAEYYDAIYVIPPVAMSVYVQYLYLCFAPFEFYFEKRAWTTIGTLMSALTNIGLNLICIRIFGYYAAGYTTLICYLIHAVMHYFFMRRVCKQFIGDIRPYDPKILIAISVFFMTVGFVYIYTYKNIWIRYGLTVILICILIVQRKKVIGLLNTILRKSK